MTTTPESPTALQPVKINVDAIGRGVVEVDGHDVSAHLRGVQVTAQANEPTEVVLLANPRGGVEFEGYARVAVGEEPDPGPAAAVFLAAIDPKLLEEAALNRPDLDNEPHGLTAAMLRQLQEWASGRS